MTEKENQKRGSVELSLFGFMTAIVVDTLFKDVAARVFIHTTLYRDIAMLADMMLRCHLAPFSGSQIENDCDPEQVAYRVRSTLKAIHKLHLETAQKYSRSETVDFEVFCQTFENEAHHFMTRVCKENELTT